MSDMIANLISILVVVLVGITGTTIFLSDRMVKRYREEVEEAVLKARKAEDSLKVRETESKMDKAGIELAKKVYGAVRKTGGTEELVGANTTPTELSEEEKRIAKEVSKKPVTDSQ